MTMTDHACHYVVESPHGAQENRGVCKHCGAVRMFPALLTETTMYGIEVAIDRDGTAKRTSNHTLITPVSLRARR